MVGEGTHVEFAVIRPGHEKPWIVVITDSEVRPDRFVWTLYAEEDYTGVGAVGVAESIPDAEVAARAAVDRHAKGSHE